MLVADDEALIRHALRVFIESSEALEVVGEAVNGAEAVELAATLVPDVVLMDLQMPVMDGPTATALIVGRVPLARVLAVTTFSSRRHVVAALRAGASGYIVKDSRPDEVIAAVHDVHAGRSALSPQVARQLIDTVRGATAQEGLLMLSVTEHLTPRELSIVELLAQGMSNAEIGRALHVSEATVKANLGRVMTKWSVRDRVQVLVHAVRAGLVSL